jgi:hypothetical protein
VPPQPATGVGLEADDARVLGKWHDRLDVGRGQHRASAAGSGVWLGSSRDVAEIAEAASVITRHSQRIDRRVGDLAELLAEEMV